MRKLWDKQEACVQNFISSGMLVATSLQQSVLPIHSKIPQEYHRTQQRRLRQTTSSLVQKHLKVIHPIQTPQAATQDKPKSKQPR